MAKYLEKTKSHLNKSVIYISLKKKKNHLYILGRFYSFLKN